MTASRGGNFVTLKQGNKRVIMQALLHDSTATKRELANRTQLTFATISNLLTELLEEGMVRKLGFAISNGGRKPLQYGINPAAYGFFGIEIRMQEIVYAFMNFKGDVVCSLKQPFAAIQGPHEAARRIGETVHTLADEQGVQTERIGGIGISVPGLIDYDTGVVANSPNMPKWRNVPFRDMLFDLFQVPCYLEKSAYTAAFSELRFGAAKGIRQMIYVLVDAGIGAGIVVNGELYRGAFNGAGEIGHTVAMENGRVCNCGKTGCLETVASGLALRHELKQIGRGVEFDHLEDLISQNDSQVMAIIAEAGKHLGTAVGNLCNTLNPDMIVIGGAVGNISAYFESAREAARRSMLGEFSNRVRIEKSQLKELSGVIGAASIAFDRFTYV